MTNTYEYKLGDKYLWCTDTKYEDDVTEKDLVEVVKVTPAGKCRVKRIRDNYEPDYLFTPDGYVYGGSTYDRNKLLPYDKAFLMRNQDIQRQKEITQEINSILKRLGEIEWNVKYGFNDGDNPCPNNALNYLAELKEMAIKIRRLKPYLVCEVKKSNGEGTIQLDDILTDGDRGSDKKSFNYYKDAVTYLNEEFKRETEKWYLSDYSKERQLAILELDRDKMGYYKVIYVTCTLGEGFDRYKEQQNKQAS